MSGVIVQLCIEHWLEARFAFHCAADHGHNDQVAARLRSYDHRCIDGDAHRERGLETGETGHCALE